MRQGGYKSNFEQHRARSFTVAAPVWSIATRNLKWNRPFVYGHESPIVGRAVPFQTSSAPAPLSRSITRRISGGPTSRL